MSPRRAAHNPPVTPEPNTNPGGQVDPAIAQILEILTQQTTNLAQQQQQIIQQQNLLQQQLLQQQHHQQQQQEQVIPIVTFKSFQAVKPPKFKGTPDPVEANSWLKEIEKAFALVKVGEELKTE